MVVIIAKAKVIITVSQNKCMKILQVSNRSSKKIHVIAIGLNRRNTVDQIVIGHFSFECNLGENVQGFSGPITKQSKGNQSIYDGKLLQPLLGGVQFTISLFTRNPTPSIHRYFHDFFIRRLKRKERKKERTKELNYK